MYIYIPSYLNFVPLSLACLSFLIFPGDGDLAKFKRDATNLNGGVEQGQATQEREREGQQKWQKGPKTRCSATMQHAWDRICQTGGHSGFGARMPAGLIRGFLFYYSFQTVLLAAFFAACSFCLCLSIWAEMQAIYLSTCKHDYWNSNTNITPTWRIALVARKDGWTSVFCWPWKNMDKKRKSNIAAAKRACQPMIQTTL